MQKYIPNILKKTKVRKMATGQEERRYDISAISLADPCIVTTSTAHSLSDFDFVRLMNLNGWKTQPFPVDNLNGKKFRVIVTDTDKFKIQDPVTFDDIDSTNETAYVSGGNVNFVQTDFDYEA